MSLNYFIYIIIIGFRTITRYPNCVFLSHISIIGSLVIPIGIIQAYENTMHILTDKYYFILQNATQPRDKFVYRILFAAKFIHCGWEESLIEKE